jgi:predicted dehydrogenase
LDYTKTPLNFRLRKAARYVRLYGPSRTLVKIRSQYHMNRRYSTLPKLAPSAATDSARHVGILGCGKFAYSVIAYHVTQRHPGTLRGAMDIDVNRAASLAERYGLAYYTDDSAKVIEDPSIDLVYIASNHASHADYAVRCLEQGKHVHIEKPHVVSYEQLTRLCTAMTTAEGRVGIGFNRPESPFGRTIAQALAAQEGAGMYNWFVAGHEIPPGHWYYRPEEGGRVLGNLCHWTDFVLRLVPREVRYPIEILPARAELSDSDISVSYVFGDGSIASITFSAKGHAFEGVRERFAAHKGEVLIALDDFMVLSLERGEHKSRKKLLTRDHGHEASVLSSYALTQGAPGESVDYIWETGDLFLRTREALEANEKLTVEPFPGVDRLSLPQVG